MEEEKEKYPSDDPLQEKFGFMPNQQSLRFQISGSEPQN